MSVSLCVSLFAISSETAEILKDNSPSGADGLGKKIPGFEPKKTKACKALPPQITPSSEIYFPPCLDCNYSMV